MVQCGQGGVDRRPKVPHSPNFLGAGLIHATAQERSRTVVKSSMKASSSRRTRRRRPPAADSRQSATCSMVEGCQRAAAKRCVAKKGRHAQ